MISWRVYYTDETTFDSSEGDPSDAPCDGGAVIVAPDEEVGRVLVQRWDWYYFKSGIWWGSDIHGLLDQIKHFAPEITAVIQGRTVLNPVWRRITESAINDPDFPPKSATRPGERP